MPDTPSITIVKKFTYRLLAEEFSNTYHFSGTVPTDHAGWKTLADAMIAAEKLTVESGTSFVRAYGYVAGNENSVAQIIYDGGADGAAVAGTGSFTGNRAPGDIAATTRWYTGELSSRGKKVYARKYWHGVLIDAANGDKLATTQKTALDVWAAKLIDGTLPGSFKYCGPQGAVLSAPQTNQYVTTRTLKRRGKRPPTL